jgi:2-polyprenyl-3-methyl-5-hydroxy-6-metoxy-1,4-benzoquinol methylase
VKDGNENNKNCMEVLVTMDNDYEKIRPEDYNKRAKSEDREHKEDYLNDALQVDKMKRISSVVDLKDKKVLELGCSYGFFSIHLARIGADVDSVDYSHESLNVAKKALEEENDDSLSLQFHQMDARNIKFPDNSFDVIVNCDFIEHIYHRDQDKVVMEMKRVLKKGGTIVTYTPNYNRLRMEYYIQKIRRGLKGQKWGWQHSESGTDHQDTELHVGLVSQNELITLFERNGLVFLSADNAEYAFPKIKMMNKLQLFPNLFVSNSLIYVKK